MSSNVSSKRRRSNHRRCTVPTVYHGVRGDVVGGEGGVVQARALEGTLVGVADEGELAGLVEAVEEAGVVGALRLDCVGVREEVRAIKLIEIKQEVTNQTGSQSDKVTGQKDVRNLRRNRRSPRFPSKG